MLALRRAAVQAVAAAIAAPRPLGVCVCRAAASTTAAAGDAASAAVADPDARAALAEKNAQARLRSIFYDPNIKLSKRQKQVYSTLEDEPPLPLMEDHGFLYGTTAAQLANRNEMVKRAVSTRTANIKGLMAFKRSEIIRKYAPKAFDTGSNRVQVAMVTERIGRLAQHLSRNGKDKKCKRSLTALTVRRRKIMEYMMRRDYGNYRLMVRELALRPVPLVNSRHLPKVRLETHKEVKARHARLKNRLSRGHKGH